MFYYNPNDSHVMVNNRVGTNSTFNLATRTGKVISISEILLVMVLLMILPCIALESRSSIDLQTDGAVLFCQSGNTRYEVWLDEIETLELIDEMPENLFRTNALGSKHLYKGKFTGGGMVDLKILADPTVPPYLKIKTGSDGYFIFGTRNPEITQQVFAALAAKTGEKQS